jgi:cell division protein FtsW
LIFIQPDLSAVITIFMMGGIMFFLAGGDLKQIGFLILLALLFGWVIVALNSTGSDRVSSYLAGLRDPFQASYHVRRSLEAFVKGGWFGAGIGNSETKLTGLPVPPTDSIFAVIGEETGVLGAIVLVILYSVLLWRGLGIARRAPDGLGTLLAAGLSIWLAMEAMINMAVMVGLLPFAGNALPFISAGGSNLMVSCIAIGILLNISRLSVKTKEEEAKGLGAVVDLRRWDRRRRVSRPRRARRSEG